MVHDMLCHSSLVVCACERCFSFFFLNASRCDFVVWCWLGVGRFSVWMKGACE